MRHAIGLLLHLLSTALAVVTVSGGEAAAQQSTQPAAAARPDDTPSIRVGMTLYADYTYQNEPETVDADGNAIHASQFNVTRSYINITGNISRIVAFRITPDIARETGSASSLAGSLSFRIKYAFAQFNLDEWTTAGTWARFGIQQTPWVDFEESIYRYRFQGTVISEREGFLSSSDAGASFRFNFPSNFGEIHAGVYNGENYNRLEVNDRKAFQVRGTVRPFAASGLVPLHGLRAHVFYNGDSYVKNGERERLIGSVTFEHEYLNAGFDYMTTNDQPSATRREIEASGYSIWATPRSPSGWELLLRYDRLQPDTLFAAPVHSRTIVGIAYWFPHQGSVLSALLLDYDGATFDNVIPAQPKQQRIAVHGLVGF